MKRYLSGLLAIIVTVTIFLNNGYVISAKTDEEKVTMNLDVVFVIDASGSMNRETDPEKIALDACNLFVDACDDTCGVGYVVYTHKIQTSKPIMRLNTSNRAQLKKDIYSIKYDNNGNTDIALGITKAMSFLEKSEKSNKDRKRAIILLSDGNTFLSGDGQRTIAESKKELQSDTEILAKKHIPVHTIGMNKDGSLDKKEIESISTNTKGLSFITKYADSLPGIINKIIAKYLDSENKPLTGNMDFIVSNRSVYAVHITITSKKSLKTLNPILTSPSGYQISLNGNNVVTAKGKTYTRIKLFSPDIGKWNLKLTGVDNKACDVELTTVYSMYLKQVIKSPSVTGGKISIVATINNSKEIVNDEDLLKTLSFKSYISGAENKTVNLVNDGKGNYKGDFIAGKSGKYTVITKAVSADKTFNKQSETFSFETSSAMDNDLVTAIQSVSSNEIQAGEAVDIMVEVKNVDSNETVSLSNSVFNTSILDNNGKTIADISLKKDSDKKYKGNYTFKEQGEYKILTVIEENDTGKQKSTNENLVVVTRPVMKLKGKGDIDVTVRSTPFSSTETVSLGDYIASDPKDNLSIDFSNNDDSIFGITEIDDSGKKEIEVTGKSAGKGISTVTVKNQYGENAVLHINVEVTNSWSDILMYGGIALVVLLLLFIVYLVIRPKLRGKIELSLKMPNDLIHLTPGGSFIKAVPHSHKIKLGSVMRNLDSDFETALRQAKIDKDVRNITVTAKYGGGAVIKGNGKRQVNNYNNQINKVTVIVKYKIK